jgi:hypothetical protein
VEIEVEAQGLALEPVGGGEVERDAVGRSGFPLLDLFEIVEYLRWRCGPKKEQGRESKESPKTKAPRGGASM